MMWQMKPLGLAVNRAAGQKIDDRELRCEMARRNRPANPRQVRAPPNEKNVSDNMATL